MVRQRVARSRAHGLPCGTASATGSFADDLDQDALPAPAVELGVEDLLPRTEVQLTVRNGKNHFAPHDLALHMRIGIILTGIIMTIL